MGVGGWHENAVNSNVQAPTITFNNGRDTACITTPRDCQLLAVAYPNKVMLLVSNIPLVVLLLWAFGDSCDTYACHRDGWM